MRNVENDQYGWPGQVIHLWPLAEAGHRAGCCGLLLDAPGFAFFAAEELEEVTCPAWDPPEGGWSPPRGWEGLLP